METNFSFPVCKDDEQKLLDEINDKLIKHYSNNLLPPTDGNISILQRAFVSILDEYYENRLIVSYSVFPCESVKFASVLVSIKVFCDSNFMVVTYSEPLQNSNIRQLNQSIQGDIMVIGKSTFAKYKNNFTEDRLLVQ